MLHLVAYDRTYLEKSAVWLTDPDTKALTMTPDFTHEVQQAFFASLADRVDYRVWGVAVDGIGPAGAAGIKRIAGTRGEYWGYLGEKNLWGRGLGRYMISAVEDQARALQLTELYLSVSQDNIRAIRLYQKVGYNISVLLDNTVQMEKVL